MKKFLYTALSLVMSVAMFTACSDDEGGNSQSYSQTPAADVAGTYVGTMTKSYVDPTTKKEVVTTTDATATIETVEGAPYVITLNQSAFDDQTAMSDKANISALSSYYAFTNKNEKGVFGGFSGAVSDKSVTYNYKKVVKVYVNKRPKNVETVFSFKGDKQEVAEETPVAPAE